MWWIGAAGGAAVGAYISYTLSVVAGTNLPGGLRSTLAVALVCVALVAGFLSGGAIFRRAGREREHLVPFSALSGATGGALIGLSQALAMTVAYLATYSTWPSDRFDQVLLVLAYPVFAALGMSVGALFGLVVGAALGFVLRAVAPAR